MAGTETVHLCLESRITPAPGWGPCWKDALLWRALWFCIHTGEEPGPQMACSQLCQPQTDLWTFYLYNSLVSLSLFLCNWQFAGFAVIRLLVIHNIKKEKKQNKTTKRLVSLQWGVFPITSTQLRRPSYLLIFLPLARFYITPQYASSHQVFSWLLLFLKIGELWKILIPTTINIT